MRDRISRVIKVLVIKKMPQRYNIERAEPRETFSFIFLRNALNKFEINYSVSSCVHVFKLFKCIQALLDEGN